MALAQCTDINQHVPDEEEERYGTDGVISRYHALLDTPFSQPLLHPGYIIGIEKSPRSQVGFDPGPGASGERSHDTRRIRMPFRKTGSMTERDLVQQQNSFVRTMNDGKVMFVSHILRYAPDQRNGAIRPQLRYSAYSRTAFGKTEPGNLPATTAYEGGWQALDRLETELLSDIRSARQRGTPFTHIVLLAMGWNNDQFEAVQRYNAIIEHTRRAAETEAKSFNPIVVGITWPSVWGGTSVIDLANRALHVGSYPAKSDDADEIGYGISNHLVNAMLPRLEAETGLQSILIGHSMGARMLTRAFYSRDLLRNAVARQSQPPLLIGLQGAFSANRFRSDFELIPPVRWVWSGEGGPYQNHNSPGGQVLLSWSRGDNANPVARYATGAAHVGGKAGAKVMTEVPAVSSKVQASAWGGREDYLAKCQAARAQERVLYVDASDIIRSHGDIRNPVVGELVWRSIDCFSG